MIRASLARTASASASVSLSAASRPALPLLRASTPFTASTSTSTSGLARRKLTTTSSARAQHPPSPNPGYQNPHQGQGHEDQFPFTREQLFAPGPVDVPPISERLKPLIPFLIWWTIITSLLVHLLRVRKQAEAELDRAYAQESVLRGLKARFEAGEVVPDAEIRRELEMVGLRERTIATAHLQDELLGELKKVGWWEVLLGRKRGKKVEEELEGEEKSAEKAEEQVVQEWTQIVKEATASEAAQPKDNLPAQRTGVAKRATSSTVYM